MFAGGSTPLGARLCLAGGCLRGRRCLRAAVSAGGGVRGRVCPRAGSGYAEGITACSRSVERSDTTGYDPQKFTTPVRGGSRIRAITRRENSRFTFVSTLVTYAPRGSAS